MIKSNNRFSNRITELLNKSQSERGISAVVTFLIMTMISTIGFTLFFITMTDSKMATRKLQSAQAFYIAEAGLEYGVKRMNSNIAINESQPIPIFNGTVLLDTSKSNNIVILTAQGQLQGTDRKVGVAMQNMVNLGGFSIYSTGDVENVTTLDEFGVEDPDLLSANADSLPPIDYLGLTDMALNQGQVVFDAEFSPGDNYPNGSFYYSTDVPNVIHVVNDLVVQGGSTIYGIYVIEGNVTLHGGARLEGVIYLPNLDSEVLQITITGGGSPTESTINGGIIANCDVSGTGNHITSRYVPDYMEYFGEFERASATYTIFGWTEY